MRKDKEQTRLYNTWYRQTYPEKVKAQQKKWRESNKIQTAEYSRQYSATPKGRYKQQKAQAVKRNIPWEISFEEWWTIWQNSGHWDQRGFGRDKYCMCRYGDIGPYSLHNVIIATTEENKGRHV